MWLSFIIEFCSSLFLFCEIFLFVYYHSIIILNLCYEPLQIPLLCLHACITCALLTTLMFRKICLS